MGLSTKIPPRPPEQRKRVKRTRRLGAGFGGIKRRTRSSTTQDKQHVAAQHLPAQTTITSTLGTKYASVDPKQQVTHLCAAFVLDDKPWKVMDTFRAQHETFNFMQK